MYTIKEVSKLTGLSAYTLRFYDKEGLFPNITRDECSRRLFSESDVQSVRTIQSLREMGFSIARIRDFIAAGADDEPSWRRRRDIFAEQIRETHGELAKLARRIAMLKDAASKCDSELRRVYDGERKRKSAA